MKIIKIASLILSLIILPGCADAADVVIDPWNLIKNAVTSANQARATVANLRQLQVAQQDFILQARNLATVSDSVVATAIDRGMLPASAYGIRQGAQIANQAAGVYQSLKSSQDEMTKMLDVINRVQSVAESVQRQAIRAEINPARLLQDQAADAQAGRMYAAKEYSRLKADLGQLEFHQKRMDLIAQEIPRSSGAQQSLQLLALQNGVLSDQLSQMLTVQTSIAAAEQKRDIKLNDQELRNWHIDMEAQANACRMGSQSKKCPEAMEYYKKYMSGKNGYP